MQLQTRTRLFAAAGIAATLLLVGLFFHAQQMVAAATEDLKRLNEVKSELAQFLTVSADYFDQRSLRARAQSEAKLRRLSQLLEQAPRADSAEALAEARRELAACGGLIAELGADADRALSDRDRRTERLLLLHGHGLVSALDKLQHPAGERIAHGMALSRLSIALLAGALCLLLVLEVALLERGILRPLAHLGAAIDRLGAGDFTTRLRNSREDEIGRLARAFDETLEHLQRITVSRDQLEQEVLERKRAEATIRQRTAELEEANRELESFAYSVSHDLRAPLRTISGFGDMLARHSEGLLDQEGTRLLSVICSGALRMSQLIDDLLAFSRLGRGEMARSTVNMDALVQSALEELRTAPPERIIEVTVDALPAAQGDLPMLRQVWINLISNAFKFTRSRSPARVEIGGSCDGRESIYWVKDNGVGFDPHYAYKLFSVFQRLHGAKEFEGNGVGLALSERIVRRHGGRIWGESQGTEGATFYFSLPRNPPESGQRDGQDRATERDDYDTARKNAHA